MKVQVCDACGKQYKPYVAKVEEGELGVEANGMTLVKIDKSGKLFGKGKMELCPECMEKVLCFVFDELTNETSPFVEKIKYYQEREKANREKASQEE